MAQAVSRRVRTAETLIIFRRDGIYDGRIGSKIFFPPDRLGFPLSLSFHLCTIFFLSLVG
jgi:hypothetical protein